MSKGVGLNTAEIDSLAKTGLQEILQFWETYIKKEVTMGDLALVIIQMGYLSISSAKKEEKKEAKKEGKKIIQLH